MTRSTRLAVRGMCGLLLATLVNCVVPGLAVAATQLGPVERSEARRPCADFTLTRRPFFGDLHVHTAWSFDASGQDTRNTPMDAYAFARGETLKIQPYDDNGVGLREIKIDRPLDFTAVTDHSEFLGEMKICREEKLPGYEHPVCWIHRNMPQLTQLAFGGYGLTAKRRWGFCGEDGKDCLVQAASSWQQVRQAAEQAYDKTADCSFTSFVGYEWTATVGRGRNLHHNVIFRNASVPYYPLSWIESPTQVQLWDYLQKECAEGIFGCDGIAIPHNSNLSGGLQFETARLVSAQVPEAPVTAKEAARRAHWTPLVEIMQHKGSSECDSRIPVWSGDELCSFEKLPYDNFGTKNTGEDGSGLLYWLKFLFGGSDFRNVKPPGESSYVRYALKKGLRQQYELGKNSLKYGMIASTDTHIAAPGLVMEKNYPGHGGAGMGSREAIRLLPDEMEFNPGGLAVLYAEENSRDALFAAMRRREAYATSGTRPTLRFFGGWEYPQAMCQSAGLLAQAYAGGVPMGGDLPPRIAAVAQGPRFLVSAQADAGTERYPGTPLQRLQIVKGWYANGELHEQVLDVAGGANEAQVDPDSCAQTGSGHSQLCTVWQDTDFDAKYPAFYYARLLENPSCRWSQQICVAAGVQCDDPAAVPDGLESCCSTDHRKIIQERAWSSPIWYTPGS